VCQRVGFKFAGMTTGSAYDCSTRALLPVRKRSGRDELVLWGRKEGDPGNSERIPSVPVNTIKNGEWEAYSPRWVKLFVARFQMPDATGAPQWHELPQGAYLQGVLIKDTDERRTPRVYIACVDVPEQLAGYSQNGQWPHVSEPFADDEITRPPTPKQDHDDDDGREDEYADEITRPSLEKRNDDA